MGGKGSTAFRTVTAICSSRVCCHESRTRYRLSSGVERGGGGGEGTQSLRPVNGASETGRDVTVG